MRRPIPVGVLAALLFTLFICRCAATDSAKESVAAGEVLSRLSVLAESGAIDRIELYHLSNRLATRVSMSSEKVKQVYAYKLEVRARQVSIERLSQALSKTATRPLPGSSIDVRTVALFYTTGSRVIEVSLTGPGVWAIVDGHPAELSPELSRYFGTLFGSEIW